MSDILTLTMNPALDLSVVADGIGPTHKIRCRDERREAGGGGINVSRVVCRLGGDCRAVFPAGGALGQLLLDLVGREGIVAFPVAIAQETRENFTATDAGRNQQYRFVLPGPTLDEAEWRACLARIEACDPARYLVASGSLPPGCPPSFYAELAALARARGAKLVVDSSGPGLAAALEAGVHLCKPSRSELEHLAGSALSDRRSQISAAQEIVASGGAEAVALTLGGDGAILVTTAGAWQAPPVPVEPVSAVGAGDSFLAGFVWALARGESWQDSFSWAVAAGTAAVLTPGSELAERHDIETIRREVRIDPVT